MVGLLFSITTLEFFDVFCLLGDFGVMFQWLQAACAYWLWFLYVFVAFSQSNWLCRKEKVDISYLSCFTWEQFPLGNWILTSFCLWAFLGL